MKYNIITLTILLNILLPKAFSQPDTLLLEIEKIAKSGRSTVGFAMLGIEDNDSIGINSETKFPMQSVYKFHLALAVLKQVDEGKLSLDYEIFVKKSDLLLNTWSPLRDKNPGGNVNLKLKEIISYAVSQSDNNACDILFKLIGGPKKVEQYIIKSGIPDISIVATEEEMHKSWDVQFKNYTTPMAAARLLKLFYNQSLLKENNTQFLLKVMYETITGSNRLKGKLPPKAKVAHKTGSSGANELGITAACNDIGIVTLPNGKHYAIAVFITNSRDDDEHNAALIADISKAVWDYYTIKSKK
jgi:beta-lactamase class A